ncbi:MAG: ATP-binding protein [Opitutales bacterium]|nr:ATP-binding protein [Opitutales bacterium]
MTTYVFAKDYLGRVGPVLTRQVAEAKKRYDLFFLCDTDIPYADTWDRSGEPKREDFQKQTLADLMERGIPFCRVSGTLEKRIARVKNVLQQHRKYGNVPDVR